MAERKIIQNARNQNEVLVLSLVGALEVSLQKTLKDEIERVVLEESDLVLDFSQVSFIDSSCLGALVSLVKDLREKKGDLKLSNLNDDVRAIFQITRLDRIFEIFDTVDEAVESYYK